MGIEPTNLLHAMQALYQLSYAPVGWRQTSKRDLASGRATTAHWREWITMCE
jgi:hypothetical protein